MAQKDRYCPACRRIYEQIDWEGPECPFCGVPLLAVGGPVNPLEEIITTGIEWPAGEPGEKVVVANGFMSGQLIKAELESAGIPVYLSATGINSVYPVTVGPLSEVAVYVPRSLLAQAQAVLNSPQ